MIHRMNLNPTPDYRTSLQHLADGKRGIAATLSAMSSLVKAYKVNALVRRTATDIVHSWPEKDYPGEVQALQTWVRDNIRYTQDVNGVETLQTPDVLLDSRSGDCDDKSILLASLLESIGHPTRFVALGYEPGVFVHVLVEVQVYNVWLPLETTEPVEAGWYPGDMPYRMVKNNG